MKFFEPLYDRVLGWSRHRHAPRYLGALSFAESSFFPVPPDVMLAPMAAARPQRSVHFATITTVFSVLGGLFGYAVGFLLLESAMPLIEHAGWSDDFARAQEWFTRWGVWVVLVAGFSPIPYKVFTIGAGALMMPLLPFILASLVGRGGRFFAVAYAMAWMGPRADRHLRPYMERLGWASVALLVVLIALVAFLD